MKTLIQAKWIEHGQVWLMSLMEQGKDKYQLVRLTKRGAGVEETQGTLAECEARVASFAPETIEPMEVETDE